MTRRIPAVAVNVLELLGVFAAVGGVLYATGSLATGCGHAESAEVYGVTCYSAGQAILDTESSGEPSRPYGAEFNTLRFTEAHTGKRFQVTGDCIVAKGGSK